MKQIELKFYVTKFEKKGHLPLHEWLLETGKKIGITKAIVLKGIAGLSPKGKILEEHFFETGSDVPLQVVFLVDEKQEETLLEKIKSENVKVFCSRSEISLEEL